MVRAFLLAMSCSLLGCEPKLVVGKRNAPALPTAGNGGSAGSPGNGGTSGNGGSAGSAGTAATAGLDGEGGAGGEGGQGGEITAGGEGGEAGAQCADTGAAIPAQTDPLTVPWATGFENEFCDYPAAGGFCFGGGTRKTVTSPVHSGRYAAEFTVDTTDPASNQTRCVRQGALPSEAYYGAWYYVPVLASLNSSSSLFNLLHFQGGDTSQNGMWDVTLVNGTTGDLHLLVYDFLNKNGIVREPDNPPPIPIGSWFHIQFYLKRASDATGEMRLYQDGKLLLDVKNVVTDDSSWAQWYVGNIGKDLTPPDSTLYVDDVTIRATLN
jgi:polysaccharide lyase-like protein